MVFILKAERWGGREDGREGWISVVLSKELRAYVVYMMLRLSQFGSGEDQVAGT